MSDYNFVRYNGDYFRGDTRIAINKSGLIRLSAGFCRTTLAKIFQNVVLFYDKNKSAIALKFISSSNRPGVFKVTKDKEAGTIAAKTFFLANNIDLKKIYGRYEWKREAIPTEGIVYIVELKEK